MAIVRRRLSGMGRLLRSDGIHVGAGADGSSGKGACTVPEGAVSDVRWRPGPAHGARYTSGLTIYDEALVDGRWKGRYWAASGFSEVEASAAALAARDDLPLHAFSLNIDGQDLNFGWRFVAARHIPAERPGACHAIVELAHALRPITVRVHTMLDGSPVLVRWLDITNTGASPASLAAVAPWSGVLMHVRGMSQILPQPHPGLVGESFSVGRFVDPAWGNEGDFSWRRLSPGTIRLESRRGRSGRPAPFFVARNEVTGEHVIGHVAWSGNWSIDFTYEEDQAAGEAWLAWHAGPSGPAPMRLIAPGDTVTTPAVHLGYLLGDLDDAVHAMHEHVRAAVVLPAPDGRANRVVYNHWSFARHELTDAGLRHEIDVAVEIGAELFIVDAGWFGNIGTPWHTTVGDWRVGDRLPAGLEPIFSYARQRGLLYGLWMDAERIGPESRTAREHPEWLLQRDGRPVGTALDLTNPAAAAWLEEQINHLVEDFDLDLFRLDYNIDVWDGGYREHGGYYVNSLWRHYEVLYGIFDRLHLRYPNLLLENCASGGGRTDLGLLQRFHYTWITDWQLAPRSIKIFNGMTLSLPPEACDRNAGVGMDSHLRGDLDTQIRSCMLGHFTLTGIYPPGEHGNPRHVDRIRHHVQLYKTAIRPWLSTSRMYHHTPALIGREPEGWCVMELVSADRRHGVTGVFRLAGTLDPEYLYRPRGLAADTRYRVTRDNLGQSFQREGADLLDRGVRVRLDRVLSSELLLFEAVDTASLPDGEV
ncbi:MAG: Alpha-galactosidase [Chloroflexi bacterium]|nr:Alpha-galactosidase [Chloroflexota bacterium]